MSTPTNRRLIDIGPAEEKTKFHIIKNSIELNKTITKINAKYGYTWKLTREARMLNKVLIPSTETNAKRYSSKRSII